MEKLDPSLQALAAKGKETVAHVATDVDVELVTRIFTQAIEWLRHSGRPFCAPLPPVASREALELICHEAGFDLEPRHAEECRRKQWLHYHVYCTTCNPVLLIWIAYESRRGPLAVQYEK
jgi:hypothetical protein